MAAPTQKDVRALIEREVTEEGLNPLYDNASPTEADLAKLRLVVEALKMDPAQIELLAYVAGLPADTPQHKIIAVMAGSRKAAGGRVNWGQVAAMANRQVPGRPTSPAPTTTATPTPRPPRPTTTVAAPAAPASSTTTAVPASTPAPTTAATPDPGAVSTGRTDGRVSRRHR